MSQEWGPMFFSAIPNAQDYSKSRSSVLGPVHAHLLLDHRATYPAFQGGEKTKETYLLVEIFFVCH